MKQMNEKTNKQTQTNKHYYQIDFCGFDYVIYKQNKRKNRLLLMRFPKPRKKIQYSNDDDDDCLMATTIFVV